MFRGNRVVKQFLCCDFRQFASKTGKPVKRFRKTKWAIGLGVCCIAGGYFAMLPYDRKEYIETLGTHTPEEEKTYTNSQMKILNKVPNRGISRFTGLLSSVPMYIIIIMNSPISMRQKVFHSFLSFLKADESEIEKPLTEYRTLNDVFSRGLKPGSRPVCEDSNAMCSPVDGRVLYIGKLDPRIDNPLLQQVKGVRYPLEDFIGVLPVSVKVNAESAPENKPRHLYYCTIYLSPSNYHRFHSPTDWRIIRTIHYPGYLYPVKPSFAQKLKGLFAINERVVMRGHWEKGFYSMTAVGATNVGSIQINHIPELHTNKLSQPFKENVWYSYEDNTAILKGDELGCFKLGSTVVLIFESTPFEFIIGEGDVVKEGQCIGRTIDVKEE